MLDLSKFGIGLGENPDMTNPFVVATKIALKKPVILPWRWLMRTLRCSICANGADTIPAGGFFDGGVVEVETAAHGSGPAFQLASPECCVGRVRGIL
ncbi:MAG: hypothetical protein IPK63_16025 [Candidatus Competibacteraceae bacterium]|nr:hypothetical protein [Candidatus Competibacteraceae bacterium]